MSSLWSFPFLWRFQLLAAGTPSGTREEKGGVAFTAHRAKRLLNFAHFIPLPLVPRHSTSGK